MQQNLVTQEMLDAFNAVIESKITAAQTALINEVFPIGKVIPQMQGEPEPGSYIPGTSWEQVTDYAGKVVVGSGNSYDLGATGGNATHTIALNELPQLVVTTRNATVVQSDQGYRDPNAINNFTSNGFWSNSGVAISGTGTNNPINIMPPYVVANYWKRIA